uniref:Large ribosomal subunit protein bL9c n=1 Tax=Dipterocladia arabiensis TaxID=2007176 RepID=A0A1Z1M129_9FLOR|nr:ribosomal protein L9 [Dipterocladia arabiensis]ARW59463.1 ribosomal protein L9 [Dipterocladia arabiensis]
MTKKINIVLLKDHNSIGQKNTIVQVSRGYALNYLIPKQIAEFATKNKMKHLNMFNIIKEKQKEKNKIRANQIAKNLISIKKISIMKKVGDNYNIFGSINEKDIIEKIFKHTGIKFTKKQIKLNHIKKIGIFNLEINLFDNQLYQMNISIIPANI